MEFFFFLSLFVHLAVISLERERESCNFLFYIGTEYAEYSVCVLKVFFISFFFFFKVLFFYLEGGPSDSLDDDGLENFACNHRLCMVESCFRLWTVRCSY